MTYDPCTADIGASLRRMGLASETQPYQMTALTGGVSSRILLIEGEDYRFCFKQALSKLKVQAEWLAPVERSRSEVAWMDTANAILPEIAPQILGRDDSAHAFAMTFLPPTDFPVWKSQLLAGEADPATAAAAGRSLAAVHAATAQSTVFAERFDNGEQFHALRIEPYFLATAAAHPDVAEQLQAIAYDLASIRIALVHGDFSPKNLLAGGRQGIVILDAECATYGDPAFDVGFCLAHLLLKQCLGGRPAKQASAALHAMLTAYRLAVRWEAWDDFERRLIRYLPALLLARIDGKSPIDYLPDAARSTIRTFALRYLTRFLANLEELLAEWDSLPYET